MAVDKAALTIIISLWYSNSMTRVYEYRLRPNKQQGQRLQGLLDSTRALYNQCLEEVINHYKKTGKHLNRFAQDKCHGVKEHPDLPAVLVDKVLDRVHRSFDNFFRGIKSSKHIGFPRFKSYHRWRSFEFRDVTHRIDGSYFLAGRSLGKIRTIVHRPVEGDFKFARIVKRPSGWYVQCVCDVDEQPLPTRDSAVGLDMGITYLLADSNGMVAENPKWYRSSLKTLAHAQKILSRKKKGSNRRRKQAKLVARHHERITNRRKDALHKLSRQYIDRYQTIVIEDLQPSNMVRNHNLAMSIADASWGMLRNMLAYKAESAGRQLIAINPRYTSQQCSKCGEYVQKALSVRTHICPHCGYVANRDVNAACNILRRGLGEAVGECLQWQTR